MSSFSRNGEVEVGRREERKEGEKGGRKHRG